jgi:hypothetical protein
VSDPARAASTTNVAAVAATRLGVAWVPQPARPAQIIVTAVMWRERALGRVGIIGAAR